MTRSIRNKATATALAVLIASPLAVSAQTPGIIEPGISDPSTVVVDRKLMFVEQVQFIEDTGAANRIKAGDLLRTLSQEIPAAVCHLHNGVSVAESTELLNVSIAKFEAVTLALLNGDDAMGIIGGETRRKTVVELEALIADWEPVRDAAMAVLADPTDATAATAVSASTDMMLDQTYHLLSELEGEYADPVELLQSDVMQLEVSGRMAAMTQRMAYEACRVWSGDRSDDVVGELESAIQIFEASMGALRNGLPELGVAPAPTPEIADSLDALAADWDTISMYLDDVLSSDEVSVQIREDLYHQLALKLHKVEEIVDLYQEFAKRGL